MIKLMLNFSQAKALSVLALIVFITLVTTQIMKQRQPKKRPPQVCTLAFELVDHHLVASKA